MANLKQRLRRKNSSGDYDVIYLQSDLSNVTGTLGVANGGTGTTSTSGIKTALSLPTDTATEINTLKTSVSNGKTLIAAAVTDKGVPTAASDSFQTMADNIEAISSGVKLNIDYGASAPSDTSKLWIPNISPTKIEINGEFFPYGQEVINNNKTKTLPRQVMCPAAGKIGDYIYVYGGTYNYNNPSRYYNDKVYRFDPSTGTCTEYATVSPSSNIPRDPRAYTVYQNRIYAFDGENDGSGNRYGHYFDISTKQSNSIGRIPYGAKKAITINNYIYIIGTQSESPYIWLYKLDPATNNYTNIRITGTTFVSSWSFELHPTIELGSDNLIHIIAAGSAGTTYRAYTLSVSGVLTQLSQNGSLISRSAACAFGNSIYAFGGASSASGSSSSDTMTDVVYKYDITNHTYTTLQCKLPKAGYGMAAVLFGTTIYLIGGSNDSGMYQSAGNFFNTIVAFDIETELPTDNLKIFTDMNTKTTALINTDDTKLYASVKNAYIGNSENHARETTAYIYTSGSWQRV